MVCILLLVNVVDVLGTGFSSLVAASIGLFVGKSLLGVELGNHAILVELNFLGLGGVVPAEDRGDEVGDFLGGIHAAIIVFDGDAGTAGDNVLKVQGTFHSSGVDGLNTEVAFSVGDGLLEGLVILGVGEYVEDEGAVAVEEVVNLGDGDAVLGGQSVELVGEGPVAVSTDDGGLFGGGLGNLARNVLEGGFYGVLTNDTVGGVLTTGDGDEAGAEVSNFVVTGELLGVLLASLSNERAEAGVHTNDVGVGDGS